MENSVKFAFDVETHDVLYNTLVLLPLHMSGGRVEPTTVCVFPPSVCPQFAQQANFACGSVHPNVSFS